MYSKRSTSSIDGRRRTLANNYSSQSAGSVGSRESNTSSMENFHRNKIHLNIHDKTLIGIISINFAIFLVIIWLLVTYSALTLDCQKVLSGEIDTDDHTDESYLYYD